MKKAKHLIEDGFIHILFGNTLNKMIAFISSVVIVRLVEKVEYGYLSYVDNLYAYINLFSGLGLSSAILKFCGPNISKSENRYFFSIALKYGSLFQILLSVCLILYVVIFDIPFPNARYLIYLSFLYPTLTYIITTIQNYVRSQLQNKLYAKMGIIQTVIVFIGSIMFTLLSGVSGVIYARYIAIIFAILIGLSFVRSDLNGVHINIDIPNKKKRDFFKMALSLMIANLFSMIMPINEMFIINNLIQDEIVTATYKVAILIPSQLSFVVNSIVIYTFPKIAQLSDDKSLAYKNIKQIGVFTAGIIISITIIGYMLNPFIITTIYGTRYSDAINLSKIFWIVYSINASFRIIPMNMLPALGITTFNAIISVISCIVHAIMDYYFILHFGMMGAAYAVIIVYVISGCAYWLFLYRTCIKS